MSDEFIDLFLNCSACPRRFVVVSLQKSVENNKKLCLRETEKENENYQTVINCVYYY